MIRNPFVLPIVLGTIFVAVSTVQARPLKPGQFLTGQTGEQAQAIVAETHRVHPAAEVIVSYDVGFRTYTVQVKPTPATHDSGAGESSSGGEAE